MIRCGSDGDGGGRGLLSASCVSRPPEVPPRECSQGLCVARGEFEHAPDRSSGVWLVRPAFGFPRCSFVCLFAWLPPPKRVHRRRAERMLVLRASQLFGPSVAVSRARPSPADTLPDASNPQESIYTGRCDACDERIRALQANVAAWITHDTKARNVASQFARRSYCLGRYHSVRIPKFKMPLECVFSPSLCVFPFSILAPVPSLQTLMW